MRIFWVIMGVLVLGTVAAFAFRGSPSGVQKTPAREPDPSPPRLEPTPEAQPARVEPAKIEPREPAPAVSSLPTLDEVLAEEVSRAVESAPAPQAKPEPKVEVVAKPTEAAKPDAAKLEAPKPEAPKQATPDAVKAESPKVESPAAAAPAAAAPAAELKIEKREDGSMLVDGRFVVKGDGTAEKPYEVTWEYLVSAGETYDPKNSKNTVPAHIQMLDGKHVRITGWIAFPLYVQSPRELLSMLNQWDGCCIGVPPTPYDAIEVRLREPVEGDSRLATFGTVSGLFSVKPYVVGGWLVGLYVMDQGSFSVGQFSNQGT